MKDYLKKYKIQLALLLYVIVVLAFWYFLVMPSVRSISDKAHKIQQQEIDHDLDRERISSLPLMEEGYEKFKDNEDKLNIAIDSFKEVDFIKELEVLAEQTNNRVEFRVQENIDKKTASKKKKDSESIKDNLSHSNYLSMQIALEGSYEEMLNFMYKLENFHNYVNIVSISSEKKEVGQYTRSSSPFSFDIELPNKKMVNTVLDVVVYINPS